MAAASRLAGEGEAPCDHCRAYRVEREAQAIYSSEAAAACHRCHPVWEEPGVAPACSGEGEGEPQPQRMVEALRELEVCCSEAEEVAEKAPC